MDSIIKGVAAAGVALGGASVFTGNDVVYAAELEQEQQEELKSFEGQEIENCSYSESLVENDDESRLTSSEYEEALRDFETAKSEYDF